jgi:hypothetical protein
MGIEPVYRPDVCPSHADTLGNAEADANATPHPNAPADTDAASHGHPRADPGPD